MMFAAGDMICYGAQGVCRVEEVAVYNFGSADKLYYVLRSVSPGGATVYVPTDNALLTCRMRKILSPEEIETIIREASGTEVFWEEDENRRKEEYHTLLTGGDRRALIRQIKAVYLHRQEQESRDRHLHVCDERFLKDAERILYDEFAMVLRIRTGQVLPYIMEQLPEDQKAALRAEG